MSKAKRKRGSTLESEEEAGLPAEEAPTVLSTRATAWAAFTGTGADLATLLQTTSLDALRTHLTTLRHLTSRNSHDEKISPSDKRIQLAAEFCRAGGLGQSTASQDKGRGLVDAWDLIDAKEQISLLPIPLFVLSNLISLLGSHQPTHDFADELIQTLLPASISDSTPSRPANENHYWNRLQLYLSLSGSKGDAFHKGKAMQNKGSQEILTMASLRLLLEMTTFAGGKYARNVFDSMNWTMKSLPRLLSMRRRTNQKRTTKTISNSKSAAVTLDRPDIRTLWTLFLLSFLCSSTGVNQPVSMQVAALSLGKDFLPAILKGLGNDPPQIVVHVLMALHAGLISDEAAAKLPRSKVVGFFSEWACKELLALYDRETDVVSVAATGDRHSIADVVHHFMLALCTHPGRGICFIDQGWYGRLQQHSRSIKDDEKDAQDEVEESDSAVYNKILLGLLKSLSPTRSSKQAELTLRILMASQELLAPYLQETTGSLSSASVEPRSMSIAWLSTTAFMGRLLGTPLPEAAKWRVLPPPQERCMHLLFPVSLTKAIHIRGIQHKDKLTRHGALVLLSRLLDRLHRFKVHCQQMSSLNDDASREMALQIDWEEEGSATDREDAIMRGEYDSGTKLQKPWLRVCDGVLEEARQRMPDLSAILSSIDVDTKQKGESKEAISAPASSLLIVEAALRSARVHYQVFEEASTADLGKLLSIASLSTAQADEAAKGESSSQRLSLICRLHALRLLTLFAQQNAGGIDLLTRQSSKDKTAFRHLLQLATSPTHDQVREASRDLVKEAMLGTILFEHNVKEWDLWQYALDRSTDILLDFFDECVQRCLKTPYRYIEAARISCNQMHQEELCVSPVFATMSAQYIIRLGSGLLEEDSAKVAFLDFAERFLPALMAQKGLQAVKWLFSNLCGSASRTMSEDEDRGDGRKVNKEGWIVVANGYQKIRVKLDRLLCSSFPIRMHQVTREIFEFATLEADDITLAFESEDTLSPTNLIWTFTGGDAPNVASVDWSKLLFSPVETRMMLYFAEQVFSLVACDNHVSFGSSVLRSTLENGQVDLDELVALLNRKAALAKDKLSGKLIRNAYAVTLLQIASEAPLDLGSSKEELLPEVYPAADEGLRHMSASVIKLCPLLSDALKEYIVDKEKGCDLYFEAASEFGPLSSIQKGTMLDRLGELIKKSSNTALVRNGLVLLKESLGVDRFMFDDLYLDMPTVFSESLLRRPDLAHLDAVLCKLLPASTILCHSFCCVLLAAEDKDNLVRLIPFSVAQVLKRIAKDEGILGPADASRYKPFMQACLARVFDASQSMATPLAQACLALYELSGLTATEFNAHLQGAVPIRPSDAFKPSALLLATSLLGCSPADFLESSFVQLLLDKSLLWLVRRFAEDEEESAETMQGIEAVMPLLDACIRYQSTASFPLLKAHLVEPVVMAAVANRMSSKTHLGLIHRLLKLTDLKDSQSKRLMVDILKSKDAMADEVLCKIVAAIVYDVVQTDAALCTPDLVASLVKLYKGTLSKTDRMMMKLFQLCESKHGESILATLLEWQTAPKQAVGEVNLGFLSRLDPVRMHETCLKFPWSRGFEDLMASGYAKNSDDAITQGAVYDPLLILAGTGALLTRDEPMSGLHWLELLRTNALGVVVCCLSSRWPSTRVLALNILANAYKKVPLTDFQEKQHLLLVLDYAGNSYREDDDARQSAFPPALPLTTTLFVAHSLRSLGIPSLYLYPLISRFMLQRPKPDPSDIPLLYNFLYSSSAQSTTAKAEKIFILRFLLACIKYGGVLEWKIMKRRHVWESICSLYTAEGADANIKRIIEDIFIAVSRKPDLAFQVVVRHSWLNYILQAHLLDHQAKSRRIWVKCIANLLESIDLDRMQTSHSGGLILKQFVSLVEQLVLGTKDEGEGKDDSAIVVYYNDTLRAMEMLVGCSCSVNCDIIHRAIQHLGHGWSEQALKSSSLPSDNEDAAEGQDVKMLNQCRHRVRRILSSVAESSSVAKSSGSGSIAHHTPTLNGPFQHIVQ